MAALTLDIALEDSELAGFVEFYKKVSGVIDVKHTFTAPSGWPEYKITYQDDCVDNLVNALCDQEGEFWYFETEAEAREIIRLDNEFNAT